MKENTSKKILIGIFLIFSLFFLMTANVSAVCLYKDGFDRPDSNNVNGEWVESLDLDMFQIINETMYIYEPGESTGTIKTENSSITQGGYDYRIGYKFKIYQMGSGSEWLINSMSSNNETSGFYWFMNNEYLTSPVLGTVQTLFENIEYNITHLVKGVDNTYDLKINDVTYYNISNNAIYDFLTVFTAKPGGAVFSIEEFSVWNDTVLNTCDFCVPNWECVGFDVCAETDLYSSCNAVNDTNSCSEPYEGDYSEFAQNICLEGQGTKAFPYIIDSCLNLKAINQNLTVHYILNNSLDCEGIDFGFGSIIGNLQGSFNGNNKIIKNVTAIWGNRGGFFSSVKELKNIVFENFNITGSGTYKGLITGNSRGSNVLIDTVGVKDSYIQGEYFLSAFAPESGSSVGTNYTVKNVYSVNNIFDSYGTGCTVIIQAGLFGQYLIYGDLYNSYTADNTFIRNCGSAKAVLSGHTGIIQNTYYDDSQSVPDSYAIGQTTADLQNYSSGLFSSWSNETWQYRDGDYPIFTFEEFRCLPNWECVGFETCIEEGVNVSCNSVNDTNSCSEPYTGDYSEFDPYFCPIDNATTPTGAVIVEGTDLTPLVERGTVFGVTLIWLVLYLFTITIKGKSGNTIGLLNVLQTVFGIVSGIMLLPINVILGLPVILISASTLILLHLS